MPSNPEISQRMKSVLPDLQIRVPTLKGSYNQGFPMDKPTLVLEEAISCGPSQAQFQSINLCHST